MNGNGERESWQDGGELLGGLLRGLDGAFFGLNGGESGGELRVALLFAIAGLLDGRILRGQGGGELLGVVTRRSPGIGKESYGDQGGDENDEIECGLHSRFEIGCWRLEIGE